MAEDIIIRYRAEVDELKSQINFLIDQQQELGDAVDNTEQIFNKSGQAAQKAVKARALEIKRLEDELRRLQASAAFATQADEVRKFDNAINQTKRDIATLRGETKKTKSGNDQLVKSFRNIGGAIAAAFSVQQIIQFTNQATKLAAQFESLRISFDFIEGSAEGGAATFQFLTDLAEEYGLELRSTIEAFRQFSGAARLSGLSAESTKRIFEDVTTAVTALGLSAQSADRVFLALSQIISKGVVSSEELRRQLGDALPGAFSIAAQSAGKTEAEFNKLLETGQIISSEFLPNFATKLRETFQEGAIAGAQSLNAELNRLQNEVTELTLSIGQDLAPSWLLFKRNGLTALNALVDFVRGNEVARVIFGLSAKEDTPFIGVDQRAIDFVTKELDRLSESFGDNQNLLLKAQQRDFEESLEQRTIAAKDAYDQQILDGVSNVEANKKLQEELTSIQKDRESFFRESNKKIAESSKTENELRQEAINDLREQVLLVQRIQQAEVTRLETLRDTPLRLFTSEERAALNNANNDLELTEAQLRAIREEQIKLNNAIASGGDEVKNLVTDADIKRVEALQKSLAKLGDTRLNILDSRQVTLDFGQIGEDILKRVKETNDQIVKEAEETGNDIFAIRRRILNQLGDAGDVAFAELLNEQFAFEDLVKASLNRLSETVEGTSKELDERGSTGGGLAALADSFRREIDLALQTRDQLISIFASISEARIQELDRQLEAVQRQYEKEQESLETARERRFITQSEYDEKSANLEEEQARKEEEIRQKKNDAARKQAVIEKASAIFDIALNTAVGISYWLRQGNIVLVALTAALGAAQIAAVEAQPVPKFAKGTKGKKDSGMAIVGEEGPEMTFLPKGSKVLPAKQTRTYAEAFDAMYDGTFDKYVDSQYEKRNPDRLIQSITRHKEVIKTEYITPVLQEQKRKYEQVQNERFADNVAHSITVSNSGLYWDLENIRKKGQRVVNADDIGRAVAKEVSKVVSNRRRQ